MPKPAVRKWTRRSLFGAAAGLAGGAWWLWPRKPPVGADIPADYLLRGQALIKAHPLIDVHSHSGRSFLVGASPNNFVVRLMRDGFEARRVADMAAAHVSAGLIAIVADIAVLGLKDGGLQVVRDFRPGEAYKDYQRQLDRLLGVINAGTIALALSVEDILAAKAADEPTAVLASEGGDFIETDLARVEQAYRSGLRSITLVHYNTNLLGDSQTTTPVHNGLTSLGHDVVSEMNRLGMIVDLAHASFQTCKDAVRTSNAPVMLSHSNLDTAENPSPRFISLEHARLIAETGGIIGAWPAGIGSKSLADFARQVIVLGKNVGFDHVAIGTDMDGNYKPVLTDYTDFAALAALLLLKGISESDVAKILGGNFLRVFREVAT